MVLIDPIWEVHDKVLIFFLKLSVKLFNYLVEVTFKCRDCMNTSSHVVGPKPMGFGNFFACYEISINPFDISL